MTTPARDTQLVRQVREGNADAWRELVERYGRLLLAVPLRMGLSQSDAEEVFQNTWVILYRHLRAVREPERLSAWIVTSARRESLRMLRSNSKAAGQLAELIDHADDPVSDPARSLDRLERRFFVDQLLADLGSPCRKLIELCFFESPPPSYAEIAERLSLAVGSVGPTRMRCLAELRRRLEARGFE